MSTREHRSSEEWNLHWVLFNSSGVLWTMLPATVFFTFLTPACHLNYEWVCFWGAGTCDIFWYSENCLPCSLRYDWGCMEAVIDTEFYIYQRDGKEVHAKKKMTSFCHFWFWDLQGSPALYACTIRQDLYNYSTMIGFICSLQQTWWNHLHPSCL